MKNTKTNRRANRNILILTYVILGVFLCMVIYLGYFLQVESEDVINNSYNARLDRFSDRIVRGNILSSDGRIIANTIVDEAGNEVRQYPYGSLFSHAAGYHINGKSGLESLGNFYLLSSNVNLLEQVLNELMGRKNPGDHMVTTLDVDLQKVAFDALGDRKGSVVVMEPDTGKVLAMVSKPDFDPNLLSDQWEYLVSPDNQETQLLNRATQGLYPPGSTFKIVTTLAYLRQMGDRYHHFSYECNGYYHHGAYTIQCFQKTAHGKQNLEQAFANSCNGAFASLGLELDVNQLKDVTGQLLFNQPLPSSIAYQPGSYSLSEQSDVWERLQTVIGQGKTQISPFHNALIVSAIANGGTLMRPYFIDHIESAGGDVVKKFMPSSYTSFMSASEAQILTEYMRGVVTKGTASGLREAPYEAAGKTGSAEFETGKETHGWFVGFAPVRDPEIVVSVLVEESGSGGKTAVPVVKKIMDVYFGKFNE